MLKIEDFFGLLIDESSSDIQPLLATLGIDKAIKGTKVVKNLIKQSGRDAPIVNIAIRQQTLKLLHVLINEKMLDYDSHFYSKEVNTSSNHDRRYGAEERLLDFALLVASTKNQKMMRYDPIIISTKQLREAEFKESRFDKCWNILSDEAQHIISGFRNAKKK